MMCIRLCLMMMLALPQVAAAQPLLVAVASNALKPVEEIAAIFSARSGVAVVAIAGSSGNLYARIRQGAPYDILLSADAERPERLEAEGMTIPDSRFTYAHGRLALWLPGQKTVSDAASLLSGPSLQRLAVAEAKAAPYGRAAMQTISALGLRQQFQGHLVYGQSAAQALLFARSGNADAALTAAATAIAANDGSYLLLDSSLHDPIVQQGVILRRAPPGARAFCELLRSPEGQRVFARYGYAP